MTERLSALLHQEVDRIDVPLPPVRDALAAGRRLRRRRRLTQVVAVAAVVGVVGAGVAAVTGGSDGPRNSDDGMVADTAPTREPVDFGPIFASGNTLYLDKGATPIAMGEIVQAMYYTSAGLLVRTNETGASDGGAPFHFALVRADHTVTQLDLTLGEVVPSTDPRLPYVAYAQADGDAVQVAVHDVVTDQEVARVDVPGLEWSGGWEAPPVTLAGDRVYVGGGETTTVVNWHTGDLSETDLVRAAHPQAAGRSLLFSDENTLEIVDVASGEALVTLTGLDSPWGSISPDGRHAMVYEQGRIEGPFDVYNLDQDTHVSIDSRPWEFGWTAGGDLYSVDRSGVHECDTTTGRCTDSPLPDGTSIGKNLVLGGKTYES